MSLVTLWSTVAKCYATRRRVSTHFTQGSFPLEHEYNPILEPFDKMVAVVETIVLLEKHKSTRRSPA